ncbi:MAG: hypothetical protein D6763_05155 [Alphaproteobacteria bacterium]|nr:MAG: hypothetical protein D6763_05155 [Alphaproteobacteria bacterium]
MTLVAVLTNPKSTRNLSVLEKVRTVIDGYNGVFHFEIGDVADIPLALKRFAEYGADLLVINGGDGTIQATFSAMVNTRPFKTPPPIAILPAGKTNMIAEDLGAGSPRPHLYLRRILDLAATGELDPHTIERHLLKIEGIPGHPPLYGMFMGAAGIVNGIRMCRRRIYPLGLPNALAHTAAVFLVTLGTLTGGFGMGGRPSPIQVYLDNRGMVMGRYSLVIATTLDRLILGFRPFSREGQGPVKYISVENGGATLVRAIWLAVTGRIRTRTTAGLTARNVRRVRLRLDGAVTIDGELYTVEDGREIALSSDEKFRFLNLGNLK